MKPGRTGLHSVDIVYGRTTTGGGIIERDYESRTRVLYIISNLEENTRWIATVYALST